jgi:hypothetical protein
MTNQPPTPPQAPRPPRRHLLLSALMVLVGLILLLPGLCALAFSLTIVTGEPSLTLLWLVCLGIGAGGLMLIINAFR